MERVRGYFRKAHHVRSYTRKSFKRTWLAKARKKAKERIKAKALFNERKGFSKYAKKYRKCKKK